MNLKESRERYISIWREEREGMQLNYLKKHKRKMVFCIFYNLKIINFNEYMYIRIYFS